MILVNKTVLSELHYFLSDSTNRSALFRWVREGLAQADRALTLFSTVNNGFMRDGQLLEKEEIDKIRHIPATIVQGRYDCVCPAKTAWDLHKGKSLPRERSDFA